MNINLINKMYHLKKIITIMSMKNFKKLQVWVVLAVTLTATFSVTFKAFAVAPLNHASIIELGTTSNVNPMIVSDPQEVAIEFTTVSAGATSAAINFSGFSGGTVKASGITVSNTGCTTLTGATNGLPSVAYTTTSSTTINITFTALSATTSYCTEFTTADTITNPSSAGVYTAVITATGGASTDTAVTVGFDVLTSGQNAYSITGTVLASFTMSLSGTTDSIGTLSSTAVVVSSGITATINTNVGSGWYLWATDTQAGLHSTTASHTIPTVGVGNVTMTGGNIGTEKYALGSSAFTSAATSYAYGGGTTGGALSSTTYNMIASNTAVASNATTVLHELVDIAGATAPATDYTDTITVIGAGSF